MIGQCLSNKNESATVAKNQNFYKLNKVLMSRRILKNFNKATFATAELRGVVGPAERPEYVLQPSPAAHQWSASATADPAQKI